MAQRFWMLPLALSFVMTQVAGAANMTAASQVTAQIAADVSGSAADPFTIAVTLTTSPEWHVYWSNPGEAGIATTFKWTVPQGYSVEPLPLPIPSTFIQPGEIKTYGYTGKTTFLFKIIPPRDADRRAGDVAFSVAINWLSCNKDQCVPGNATLELSLPVREGSPVNAGLFAAAKKSLPTDMPPGDVFAMALPYADGADEKNAVQIGWARVPATVEAFPPAIDGLNLDVVGIETAAGQPRQGPLMAVNRNLAGTTQIHMKSHVLVGQKPSAGKVPLLIVYTMPGDADRKAFFVDVDAAALGVRP